MSELAERVSSRLRNSQTLRLVTVGILVLLLQIPVAMIGGLVTERKDRGEEAAAEVSAKWGGRQLLSGPMVVVPYLHTWTETSRNGQSVERTGYRHASFLPDEIRIDANATSEIRKRGIFAVPVYRLDLTVTGRFSLPELSQLALDPAAMAWDRVRLELPESSFMSGHPFAVIARLTMRPWRWRATYQRTAQPQGATRLFGRLLRIGAALFAGVEIASRFRGRRRVTPAGLFC